MTLERPTWQRWIVGPVRTAEAILQAHRSMIFMSVLLVEQVMDNWYEHVSETGQFEKDCPTVGSSLQYLLDYALGNDDDIELLNINASSLNRLYRRVQANAGQPASLYIACLRGAAHFAIRPEPKPGHARSAHFNTVVMYANPHEPEYGYDGDDEDYDVDDYGSQDDWGNPTDITYPIEYISEVDKQIDLAMRLAAIPIDFRMPLLRLSYEKWQNPERGHSMYGLCTAGMGPPNALFTLQYAEEALAHDTDTCRVACDVIAERGFERGKDEALGLLPEPEKEYV